METPHLSVIFFSVIFSLTDFLNQFDEVFIEEGRDLQKPYGYEQLEAVNTGNNCFHFVFVKNKHRIVIQTYKRMNHETIDVVQGKLSVEPLFQEFVNALNQAGLSDVALNILFINHCNRRD